jgi:hypothetical protein
MDCNGCAFQHDASVGLVTSGILPKSGGPYTAAECSNGRGLAWTAVYSYRRLTWQDPRKRWCETAWQAAIFR